MHDFLLFCPHPRRILGTRPTGSKKGKEFWRGGRGEVGRKLESAYIDSLLNIRLYSQVFRCWRNTVSFSLSRAYTRRAIDAAHRDKSRPTIPISRRLCKPDGPSLPSSPVDAGSPSPTRRTSIVGPSRYLSPSPLPPSSAPGISLTLRTSACLRFLPSPVSVSPQLPLSVSPSPAEFGINWKKVENEGVLEIFISLKLLGIFSVLFLTCPFCPEESFLEIF